MRFESFAVLAGGFNRQFVFQINIIGGDLVAPGKYFLKIWEPFAVLDLFQKINFVFLFLDAHFVKDFIVLPDAERVEIFHHDKIFADVAALEFAGEEIRHEPADDVAARGNEAANDVKFDLVKPRDGNAILLHDGENIPAMTPLVVFDLLHRDLGGWVFQRFGVTDVGKRGGLFRRVSSL